MTMTTAEVTAFRQRAEQGDADAQFNLGVVYYTGDGVPQDYTEAAAWTRLAADLGPPKLAHPKPAPKVQAPTPSEIAQSPPSLFVGPQMRDGFADVTAEIRDSIGDIQGRIGTLGFTLAASPESATIVLVVLGRGIVNGRSIGFDGYVVPYERPTVSALLRVGTNELLLQSEADTWRGVADQTLKDVQAWWLAKRTRLSSECLAR